MGVDATIVVAVPCKLTPDGVRRAAVKMATAFGAHALGIYRGDGGRGTHALEIVDQNEHYGVIRPEGGTLVECNTRQSYYGPGYERGNLGTILAHCDWVAREFPGAVVYYGGDTGAILQPIADQLDELLAHWHGPNSRAYYDRTYRGAQAARPICAFCSTVGHKIEMSYCSGEPGTREGASYECPGCGKFVRRTPTGNLEVSHPITFGYRKDAQPVDRGALVEELLRVVAALTLDETVIEGMSFYEGSEGKTFRIDVTTRWDALTPDEQDAARERVIVLMATQVRRLG